VRVLLTQPAHYRATLVTGDVLSGTGGRLHVFVDEADPARLLTALEAIAGLPIEQVIIPHGDLIRRDGAARIRAAVAEARHLGTDRH